MHILKMPVPRAMPSPPSFRLVSFTNSSLTSQGDYRDYRDLSPQHAVISVSSISIINEHPIVVFAIGFLKVFAVDDAADGRFFGFEERHEKSYDESPTEDPNGPVVSGAEEPRLEEITIQKDTHSRQNTMVGGRFDRAFLGGEKGGYRN